MPHTTSRQRSPSTSPSSFQDLAPPPNSPLLGMYDAIPCIANLPLPLDYLTTEDKKEPVLVVGISGCTSSGKSLLASLLREVFDGSIIIHQDCYFQPKSLCPLTDFSSEKEDQDFMFQSMTDNQSNEYFITTEGHASTTYKISGPDTDCNEAIDFTSMLGTVTRVINTGILPDHIEYPGNPGLLLSPSEAPTPKSITLDLDIKPYNSLINKLRIHVSKKVRHHAATNVRANRLGKYIQAPPINGHTNNSNPPHDSSQDKSLAEISNLLPIICLVEGFLLFTPPSPLTIVPPTTISLDATQHELRTKYQTISDLTHELEVAGLIDDFSLQSREEIEKEIWDANFEAKKMLDGMMDIKLFLSCSKKVVKERRFARSVYVDKERGGERKGGQMWKTLGYFENVAWMHYIEEHKWLLEGKGVVDNEECKLTDREIKGVCYRAKTDADVEETLRWAVNAVLHKLCEEDIEEAVSEAEISGGDEL